MKRSILITLLLLIFPLVLVACDDGDDDNPEDASLPEQITLETTFGQSATVRLPHGWPARGSNEANQLIICNHETCGSDFIGGNQVLGNMFVFGGDALPSVFNADMSAEEVLLVTAQGLAAGLGAEIDDDDIDTFTIHDKEGASIVFDVQTEADTLEYMIVVVKETEVDGFSIINMNGAEGEVEQFDNLILAIAGSVEFAPLSE